MSARRGMTLIEVLVAITLVALLSVGMLFSIRTGLNSVETIRRHTLRERRVTNARRVLEQEFANMVAIVALCGAGAEGSATAMGAPAMFFQGEPNAIRFVSSYSLDGGGRGPARIVEIFPVAGEQGGIRLVLNERSFVSTYSAGALCVMSTPPVGGTPMLQFAPMQPTPRSYVLADHLASVSFTYRWPTGPTMPDRWESHWLSPQELPDAVRIDMLPERNNDSTTAQLPFFARLKPNRRTYDPPEQP